jgi:uncharacterized repeat protein (TIGR01451 family)
LVDGGEALIQRDQISGEGGGSRIGVLLLALALLLGAASSAQAVDCSTYPGGVLDGASGASAPSQIQVDRNCTIRNFPASNPLPTNFSFLTQPGQNDERWLIVFDNVVHTGQMACNAVAGHKIWFTNGSSTSIQEGCQNLLIPVEKIDKQTPAGQTTAAIGAPFTYTLTIPVLFDPATGGVIDNSGSPNDLHGVTVIDDLNATGVDLTYLIHDATWKDSGTPVAHTFSNVGGLLTFDAFPIIPAGDQIVLEITVVLDDTPANTPGTSFINTAKWDFGRLIDGVFYEPLPGEWGISPPLTIAAPRLVVTKTGPATLGLTLNLGQWGVFSIDAQNTGLGDAWNVTLLDRLPNAATAGMCDTTPEVLSAQVFASDGVSAVPGKGPLIAGTDFLLDWAAAPSCELTLTLLSAAGTIGADERLIVTYRAQLDSDTQDGSTLTNVAGATEWFNADPSVVDRQVYSRTLTNGTVGDPDHEDAHTVTAALFGVFFEKTVENLTSGVSPTTTAAPGDTLRYTLRLQATDAALSDLTFFDDLGAQNPTAVFVPGTLSLVAGSIPAGADTTNTNPSGGANGAGILDVRNLSVPQNSEIRIQFDITLASGLGNGTVVTNQSELIGASQAADSDDPNVNGQADPAVAGDEDPTRVVIQSAPAFRVQKVSTYITGDPNVLLPGETLRYTITVKNVGNADVFDATLRDAIPVNTSYVTGSTTLNGTPVPDGPGGASPLSTGIPIHAPENPTPGAMRADGSATQANVATLVFDVLVDPGVIDGTVLSNQSFVSAIAGGISDQPSDDPRTPTPDDPTLDVVGLSPLLFAPKSVAIGIDGGTPGVVDPGDTLHYTIRVQNNGSVAATDVVLADDVPANTSYVPDSATLNGLPLGQPGAAASPLRAGIPISSSDLTPPLPGPGEGTLSPGETALIEFDLLVDAGATAGTLISNQAVVGSSELANLLTDGDGNPATGPEPTVVVVGDGQQLAITKQVSVVGGGAALAGSELEYVVRVVNNAAVPAFDVVISDDLDVPIPGQLSYVDASATLNGSAAGVVVVGSIITADYSAGNGPLQPGESLVLRFRAEIDPGLAIGTTVTNVGVVTWGSPQQMAIASVSVDVGGMPGVGVLQGSVWHDADFDKAAGANERLLEGWSVDLYRDGQLVVSVLTDASGTYQIGGLTPNDVSGELYELRFEAPGAGANTATLGTADSGFTNGPQTISGILVPPGSILQDLNLPIAPNGVVYAALQRTPIAGVSLSLLNASAGAPLPSSCFDDPAQQGQVTLADGYYKFDLNFSDATCPSGASYLVAISLPGAGFVDGYSQLIPPLSDGSTPPFSVPTCPGGVDDAVFATPQHCEAQPSEFAPPGSVPAGSAGTAYHVHLTLDDGQVPGSSQIFNNHLAVDPVLDNALSITKTTPAVNVSRGQLVPYEINVMNSLGVELFDVSIVDRFPAGFRYVKGSAQIDGVKAEPTINGQELEWSGLTIASPGGSRLRMLFAVGAGVSEGEFVNRAQVVNSVTGAPLSEQAVAKVRVVPDPTFACTDVMGKVFDDRNRNALQDPGEKGIPGVRLVTARGLAAKTDSHGRYHLSCAATPNEQRGSNFVLKLDDRTLPSGFRMSTPTTQVKRASRGKALRFNFAASVHRVVALDMADAVFEPGTTQIRPQWQPRLDLLLGELEKAPATLRLSYVADVEGEDLVERRLSAVEDQIAEAWEDRDSYELTIEPEIFWRRGGPPNGSAVPARSDR